MNHAILFFLCIFSLELLIKLNFLNNFFLSFVTLQKTFKVLMSANISDHWKEKVVPVYALSIMKYSLQILLILVFIFFIFVITNYFFNNLIVLMLSFIGIIESMMFAFGYAFLRKSFIK